MTTYTATAPDGQTFERQSSRAYTHALASKASNSTRWSINSFSGSLASAERRMKQLAKFYGGDWQIIEVVTK